MGCKKQPPYFYYFIIEHAKFLFHLYSHVFIVKHYAMTRVFLVQPISGLYKVRFKENSFFILQLTIQKKIKKRWKETIL